ncbi:RNA-directed DNA polymerase, eukaryota [Tanacetum coccineum]
MPNLYTILSEEGFQNIKITYLGGMWVLLDLDSIATKEKLLNHTGVGSWFSIIKKASDSFECDERIIWVSIEGKVFWIRAKEIDAWTSTFHDDPYGDSSADELQDDGVEDIADDKEANGLSDIERVSESSFMQAIDLAQENPSNSKTGDVDTQSEDPFNLYDMLNGQHKKASNSSKDELEFPPGFTPINREREFIAEESVHTVNEQEGETVLMGDFNEVRLEHERFGTLFNHQGANAFNNFISLDGLIDLPLEGYAFTWAHKSASKMSKLDRFIISEGLLMKFPHLSALCLDRHLSDHRPILMRESNFDFGPTPFWVFHSWFSMEGFDTFVETTWKSMNVDESNGLIRLKKKLQCLKNAIKDWVRETRTRLHERKTNIKKKLSDIDKIIDQGKGNEEVVNSRSILLKELQDLSSLDAIEISQKAKIRWSIEGDENTKYFHDILNKNISQLAIRGTLVNGDWISDPVKIKYEFFSHFKQQFSPPQTPCFCFDFICPNRLSSVQVEDLERIVTYDEVKRAVWDCGANKSPGPDGFSFEFFHKFLGIIDQDVF